MSILDTDFDVIIVGSGPAGVSSAFPLVQAGLRVLMVDGGKKHHISPPDVDFLSARSTQKDQWKWIVGEDFHALKMLDAVSPKLRVPAHAYAFEGFKTYNKLVDENFIALGSLATGGLSNAWGCGVARFSELELKAFPFPVSELDASYAEVSRRVGISGGREDDLSNYFGLDEYTQPPIAMDALHEYMHQRYLKKRLKLHAKGFRLGRSRIAVLSKDLGSRQACDLSGNCLWGCKQNSMYSATDELPELRKYKNFSELSGYVVDRVDKLEGAWSVASVSPTDNVMKTITGRKIVLAAGTFGSTHIVLKSSENNEAVSLLSSPTAAFLLWLPRLFGAQRMPGLGLGQLSYSLNLQQDVTAFGSTFSTSGILQSEFVRHIPLSRRYGIDFLRGLLSSCVVGNLFLPGDLTSAEVKLQKDGVLKVTGQYGSDVEVLMNEARSKLRNVFLPLGGFLLPGSFSIGKPGGDIHYAGTMPMKKNPVMGETSKSGEVFDMKGVHVVDGACLPVLTEKSHTLTIMANADRIGRYLANQLSVS